MPPNFRSTHAVNVLGNVDRGASIAFLRPQIVIVPARAGLLTDPNQAAPRHTKTDGRCLRTTVTHAALPEPRCAPSSHFAWLCSAEAEASPVCLYILSRHPVMIIAPSCAPAHCRISRITTTRGTAPRSAALKLIWLDWARPLFLGLLCRQQRICRHDEQFRAAVHAPSVVPCPAEACACVAAACQV